MATALGEIRRMGIYLTHHAEDIPLDKRKAALRELAAERAEILQTFRDAEKETEHFSRVPVAP